MFVQMRQDVTLGNNKKINVEIFDTAGQERFRTITTAYYKASRAFLLVFDLGKRDSFKSIESWLAQIDKFAKREHVRFLIGNKCDSDRDISYDEAMDWAKENNCTYFEISAKTGKNIDALFAKVMDVRSRSLPFSPSKKKLHTHTHRMSMVLRRRNLRKAKNQRKTRANRVGVVSFNNK